MTHEIESTSIGDLQRSNANKEYWKTTITVKGKGEYRGIVWDGEQLRWFQSLKKGDKVEIELIDSSPYGPKWEVKPYVITDFRIRTLETRINDLIRLNSLKWKD